MTPYKNIKMLCHDYTTAPRNLYSASPRLTIRQAFTQAAKNLPDTSSILYWGHQETITLDLYPYCTPERANNMQEPEPTHLAYRFLPAMQSIVIGRIYSHDRRAGIGSAMIASQMPFWQHLGIKAIALTAHDASEGFYRKLGFERVARLAELPHSDGSFSTLMRLDLENPSQKTIFDHAMKKTKPLSSFNPIA